jgi:hypothetical protein
MARWERDSEARKRAAGLLVSVEGVALLLNLGLIFWAYFRHAIVDLGLTLTFDTVVWTEVAVLAAAAVLGLVQSVLYVRGSGLARWAFILQNVALIALGVVWFATNRMNIGEPTTLATVGGLVIPMVTLFPLLWPLLTFRPVPPHSAPFR